jgi:DNA-binding NtrC family response regulator
MAISSDKQRQTPGTQVEEGKRTILIYSPDLNFCFSLSMLFQDRYNVITTTSIGSLDKFVSDYSADLVLIDAVPSEKLLQRIEALKQLKADLPLIMLYVYNGKDVRLDQNLRKQVAAVFYKPFEVAAVSQKIQEILTPRR